MSEATNGAQVAANEANARLQEMEAEIAGLPAQIRQAENNARSATTEAAVLNCLSEKETLEKRQKALPYLIPQARIVVLKARAELASERLQTIRAEIPAAIEERDAAKAAFEQAERRYKEAQSTVTRLQASESGTKSNYEALVTDADNIAAGKPTVRYFR